MSILFGMTATFTDISQKIKLEKHSSHIKYHSRNFKHNFPVKESPKESTMDFRGLDYDCFLIMYTYCSKKHNPQKDVLASLSHRRKRVF